jgi:hypothetical protein
MNSKFIALISLLLFNLPINAQEEIYPISRLLWGNSKTHCVTEDYAFIGAGGAILICNIVSTDSLEVLNYFYLPTTVNDVYVENDILYALDYREGLFVYDITDIYNPAALSELNLGNYCYDFTYDSNYVYVSLGANGIKKVNVSDLSSPYVETESSIRAFNIQKFQSYLYCIPGYEYIASDSISILYSSNLVQGGTLNAVGFSTWIEGIYFNEDKGFLLEWFAGPSGQNSSAGIFTILDLSNPLNPQRLGNLVVYDYFFEGVSCIGDTVLAYTCTELFVIDAQSVSPSIISQTYGLFINSCSAYFSSILNSHFYLSYDGAAGFLIINISNLLNPEQGYYLNTNNATEVVWLKDSLLFAGGGGIYMADVSDMSNPVLIKRFTENVGTVRDIKTNDSLLFAASNTFKIFKIHDNDSLSFFSELNYGSQSSQVAIDDTLAAVGGRYWGLHLIDISDPSNPLYIKNVPLPAGLFYVKHLAFQNNKLIVSDYQRNTPVIYDVSDPNNPIILYEGNYATTAFCIAESDTVLFVGDSDNDELVVLNIKDLNNIYEISSIPVLGYPSRIEDSFVNENLLFLICFNQDDYDSYLRIYDITDLNNIVELSYSFLPEWAVSVCANNNISAVSDFYDGLYIYDISDFIPVELINFTAKVSNKDIHLSWITATETNNMGFEIQRLKITEKDKLTEWKKIGFVEGKGTTTETHTYSFTDSGLNPGFYSYRLKQIDFDGTFEYSQVIDVGVENPEKFYLYQNYPNPFNPNTKIKFSIASETNVNLTLFNLLGERIKEIKNENMRPGYYEINFDASNLSSGIYFYRITADEFVETKKMILMR